MKRHENMAALSCSIGQQTVEYSTLSSEEQEKILHLQQAILESVAHCEDHLEIINQVCRLEEQLLPDSVGSVMLMDNGYEFLNVYAAPSIPPEAVAQLNGLRPGPGAGSCGNVIYRREPQFVSNTFTDPRWQDLRQLAYDFNLCSCWSVPIYSVEHKIVGAFALSSFEHRLPSPFHNKVLEIGSSIIGI
ncbi:MAG: GAF domain-containing protein, partial [Methylococcales bacterium]|nr:GAF domain-containing protein [Methylococcales bacterium]